ncbi:hypothetical protein ES702_03449 [subsurface metagenome]
MEEKKRIFIQFEVSKEEKKQIQDYSKDELHLTMSAFIRSAIFKEMKDLNGAPGQSMDNTKMNKILEILKTEKNKTQILEKQNELLSKMYKMQLEIKTKTNNIPEKTEEVVLNLIIEAIEKHRTRLTYKVNQTPMLTRDIILKTKLTQKEVVSILIKNQNKIFKQIGKGWDIIDDK